MSLRRDVAKRSGGFGLTEAMMAIGIVAAACWPGMGLEAGSVAGKLWIVEPNRLREYQPDN